MSIKGEQEKEPNEYCRTVYCVILSGADLQLFGRYAKRSAGLLQISAVLCFVHDGFSMIGVIEAWLSIVPDLQRQNDCF